MARITDTRLEELAHEKNEEIQTIALTGKDIVADFTLNEDETETLFCPAGNVPTSCKYNQNTGQVTAAISGNCCASRPHRNECNAKVNNKKSKSIVRISGKTVSRAKQAQHFSTEEGKKNACRRNGV